MLAALANPAGFEGVFIRNPTADQIAAYLGFANQVVGAMPDDGIEVIWDGRLVNLATQHTRGIDFNAAYTHDTALGQLRWFVNASLLLQHERRATPAAAPLDLRDTIFNPVDLRARAGVSWSNEGWPALAAVNYVDDYRDNISTPNREIDEWVTWDARFLLYVGGQFDNAAGTPLGFGVAIWDGNQWRGLPGAFTTPPPQANDFSRVYDLTFWRDSLYICGPFNSIDGEPIRQVAQYVAELPSMGINDHGPPSLLSIAPNPARDNFLLRELPKGAMRVQLRDGLGRLLLNEQAGPGPFDISSLPSGLYHIVVADRFGLPLARAPLVKH